MEEANNFDEEDEDVVIQGSALHEHLSKLGYTDFESVSIPKKSYVKEEKDLRADVKSTLKQIYIKLMSFYSWIIQEDKISEKQLNVILKTEVLLNDHFSIINGFLTRYKSNSSRRITWQELIVTGVILTSSACISICKYKMLPILFASSAICCASYIKCLRFYTNKELKNVISLQNELYAMCKESLKILRHNSNMKHNFETCQQFLHPLGEKLQYLQPLTNTLVQFMENVSCVYYQSSLSILRLLPKNVLNEELFTKFERDEFAINSEINYETLKKLYHIYLLVQSEMLHLLAIAYDSGTWAHSCQKMPETMLAHVLHVLAKTLTMYKVQLSGIINAYHACTIKPIQYKLQNRAKWHDPAIQLDLASYKLQLSYSQMFSIFKDIDDCINREGSIDKETAGTFMARLQEAFKEMDTAKSLAEFVVLLIARSEFNNLRSNVPVIDSTMINQNSDSPVIIDSDPEILDEVFEEYVKEDYRKPLHEDVDEYSLEQYKLDKLLEKSFMNELKKVLIDKYKSMSERESKALQRMYRNVIKESAEDSAKEKCRIPTPPPLPPHCIWSTSTDKDTQENITENSIPNTKEYRHVSSPPPMSSNSSYKKCASSSEMEKSNLFHQDKMNESEEAGPIKTTRYRNVFNESNESYEFGDEASFTSLPQILLESQERFAVKLPPIFLQEETFIGSGENSEDEVTNGESDDGEDNINS